MNVNVYYRSLKNELRTIAVSDVECPLDARHEVLNLLDTTGEKYIRPVLALVKGHK